MPGRIKRANHSSSPDAPERYSPSASADRVSSFRYAAAGCAYMLRHQKNTRIMLAATVIVFPLALWLGISSDQWAILILCTGSVWVAEFINAAIEAAVNLSVSEFHPMAKAAKDVAAAAVLIAVLVAVLIGLLILGPPILGLLSVDAGAS